MAMCCESCGGGYSRWYRMWDRSVEIEDVEKELKEKIGKNE